MPFFVGRAGTQAAARWAPTRLRQCRLDGRRNRSVSDTAWPLEPVETLEQNSTVVDRNPLHLMRVTASVRRTAKASHATFHRPPQVLVALVSAVPLVIVTLVAAPICSTQPPAWGTTSSSRTIALWSPGAMAEAPGGGAYIYDSSLHQVILRQPNGAMSVVAGDGKTGGTGDGGPATRTAIGEVVSLADGPDGTLYLSADGRVRAVAPSGRISTIAGDGGLARQAVPSGSKATDVPIGAAGIAVSPEGELYVGLEASNQVMALRQGRLHQVLGSRDFLGTDPLFPQDDQPGITTLAFDDAGNLYIGGTGPYVVFSKAPTGAVHAVGLLRLNPPDALAAGPAGSVVDAGTLSAYRFKEADHGTDLYSEGELVSNYSLKGLLNGGQYLSDAGVAVLANGTVLLAGDAFGAPGDCHHAVLVAVMNDGQAKLLGNWQHYKTGPSC